MSSSVLVRGVRQRFTKVSSSSWSTSAGSISHRMYRRYTPLRVGTPWSIVGHGSDAGNPASLLRSRRASRPHRARASGRDALAVVTRHGRRPIVPPHALPPDARRRAGPVSAPSSRGLACWQWLAASAAVSREGMLLSVCDSGRGDQDRAGELLRYRGLPWEHRSVKRWLDGRFTATEERPATGSSQQWTELDTDR
jgi:hypothetical protein